MKREILIVLVFLSFSIAWPIISVTTASEDETYDLVIIKGRDNSEGPPFVLETISGTL